MRPIEGIDRFGLGLMIIVGVVSLAGVVAVCVTEAKRDDATLKCVQANPQAIEACTKAFK